MRQCNRRMPPLACFATMFLWPLLSLASEPWQPPRQRSLDEVYWRLETLEAQMRDASRTPIDAVVPAGYESDVHCIDCNKPADACGCDAGKAASPFPTFKVTGFFQLDGGLYWQSANNRATLGDIDDGLGFRRARLAAVGEVATRTSYIMEFDFAQAQPRFVDVWMQFAETPLGNIRVGRYRQPFGMTELTSVRELPFLERPLPFALAPFRQTGIMLFDTAWNERLTWAASGYRYLSDNFGNVYADNGGYGFATRLTVLPIDSGDDGLLHFGVDYSYNDPGRDLVIFANTNEFLVSQNPELGPAGLSVLPIIGVPPFVITGAMPTSRTNLFNVEGAFSLGRFVLQSEVRWAIVEQPSGLTNTFPGAYAHVRYVLTGETIPYNRSAASFGRVKPLAPVDFTCGQWGAWEIAARISYLDLNGAGLPGPGRRLTDVTVGLNWYINDYTKFQLNWIHADLNDPVIGPSSASTVALRGQLDF